MFRVIKASKGADKVQSKSWSEFCDLITEKWGFNVDSAYRRKYSSVIDLIKEGEIYEAEVTKYTDGTYELVIDNIYETEPDERGGW